MYALVSNGTDQVSLYLVDDVPELRELIRYGLEEDEEIEVVGEAGDGRSAIRGVGESQPSAVLLDLSMPDMDGLEAIPRIREVAPDTAIVVLSGFTADRMGEAAKEQGADAYIEKGAPIAEIRDITLQAVAKRRSSSHSSG